MQVLPTEATSRFRLRNLDGGRFRTRFRKHFENFI